MSGLIINPYAFATGGGGGGTSEWLWEVDPSGSAVNNRQTGFRFTAEADLEITKVRVFSSLSSSTSRIVRIWRVSDEAEILTTAGFSTTAATWGEYELPSSVALSSGADYIITAQRDTTNPSDWTINRLRTLAVASLSFSSLVTYVEPRTATDLNYPTDGTGNTVVAGVDAFAGEA